MKTRIVKKKCVYYPEYYAGSFRGWRSIFHTNRGSVYSSTSTLQDAKSVIDDFLSGKISGKKEDFEIIEYP